MLRAALLALPLVACGTPPACLAPTFVAPDLSQPGNVLVVILDDVGVEQLAPWGLATHPAVAPTIDCLCERGLRFTQAYASPVCSPTRAEIQTGRFAQRYSLGDYIRVDHDNPYEVPTTPASLAEVARSAGYRTGMFGKWHLAEPSHEGAKTHPNRFGYDHFAGSMSNLTSIGGDTPWFYVVDGKTSQSYEYPATANVDDALDFVADDDGRPWLVVLSFHNAHIPIHTPPDELLHQRSEGVSDRQTLFLDMIQATDTELARFLGGLSQWDRANTTVILLGDNGTVTDLIPPDVDAGLGKGSLDEAGIRVPIVMAGRGVPSAGHTDALAHAVDIVPTVADLLGVELAEPVDGVSWLPLLEDPSAELHPTLVNFRSYNVGGPPEQLSRTIRDRTRKLTIDEEGVQTLVEVGPDSLAEGPDLLAHPDELAALERLRAELAAVEATLPW